MNQEQVILLDERLYKEVLKAYDTRSISGLNQFSNIMLSNDLFAKFLNSKFKTEYTKDQVRHSFDRLIDNGKIERQAIGKYMYTRPTKQVVITQKTHEIIQEQISTKHLVYAFYNKFKVSHVGTNSAISMKDIAEYFDISERKVRDIVKRINYRGFVLANGETFKRKYCRHH